VQRDAEITIDDHHFDLLNNAYFMMLVSGSTQDGTALGYHTIRVVSEQKVDFSSLEEAPEALQMSPETSTAVAPVDTIYHGCGVVKNCFGIPDDCVEKKDCTSFTSVTKIGEKKVPKNFIKPS
jgi:hypothetical protein